MLPGVSGHEVFAERFHLEAPCQASLPSTGHLLRGAQSADDSGCLRTEWRTDGFPTASMGGTRLKEMDGEGFLKGGVGSFFEHRSTHFDVFRPIPLISS